MPLTANFKDVQLDCECCYLHGLYLSFWLQLNSIWLPFSILTNVLTHFVNIFLYHSALVSTCTYQIVQCTKLQPTFSSILTYINPIYRYFHISAAVLMCTNLVVQLQQTLSILTYIYQLIQFSVHQIEYPLGGSSKTLVMLTSCWQLPWYYYCDVRQYYCDIRTFI